MSNQTQTKMKTNDYKCFFTAARQELKKIVHQIALTRMVAQNIIDIIPAGWQLTIDKWLPYRLIIKPKIEGMIDLSEFDRTMAKFAKVFRKEPHKEISTESVTYDFYVYPCAFGRKQRWESVLVEFTTANTEKCDFITTQKTIEVNEPTGYCKALYEKTYLKTTA